MGLFTYQQLLVISALLFSTTSVGAVDRSKFRTCHDTGFCKAYREHNAMFKVSLISTMFFNVYQYWKYHGCVFTLCTHSMYILLSFCGA